MNKENTKIILAVVPLLALIAILGFYLSRDTVINDDVQERDTQVTGTSEVLSESERLNSAVVDLSISGNEKVQEALEAIRGWDFESSIENLEELLANSKDEDEKLWLSVLLIHSYLDQWTVSYNEPEFAKKARDLLESSWMPENSWYYKFYMWYSYEIERDYEKAILLYREAEGKAFDNDTKSRTYNQIWHVYDLDWNLDKASEFYNKAMEADRWNISAVLNFARMLVRKWESEKAVEYFERVANETEDVYAKAEVYFDLSSLYMYMKGDSEKNIQKSIDYAQKAVDTNWKYPLGYIWVARVLIISESNLDHAERSLQEALKLNPELSLAYEWLWMLEQGKWNFDKSIEYFNKTIEMLSDDITLMRGEIDQDKSRLYYLTAVSYAFDENKEKALENLKIAFDYPNLYTLTLFKSEIEKENYGVFAILKWNEEFENLTKWKKE